MQLITHSGFGPENNYKGSQLAGVSLISSGREGRNTVTGNFHIIQNDKNHESSLFGEYVDTSGKVIQKDVDTGKDALPRGAHYNGAKMPNFMRIVAGIGMHEGFLSGYPASHGCIRLPALMAEAFFRSVAVGTPAPHLHPTPPDALKRLLIWKIISSGKSRMMSFLRSFNPAGRRCLTMFGSRERPFHDRRPPFRCW